MTVAKKTCGNIFVGLTVGISILFGRFATGSAIAQTPIVFTDSTVLTVDFSQCKNKATIAAKSLLSKIKTVEARGLRFKITGTTSDTVGVIYCIERAKGTIAIITTSTYNEKSKNKASLIYDRLTSMMTN